MSVPASNAKTLGRIARILDRKKDMIRLSLQACAHCAMCADSCFKFRQSGGDPTYTPSYKMINSIGRILGSRGRLTDDQFEDVRELAFDKCVLCMRCVCPVGISIPSLIALARSACRERGVWRWHTTRRNA